MSTDAVHHTEHPDSGSKVIFGFWIFILTDFIVFAALFATYGVLHNNTYGGLSIKEIVDLPYALLQSLIFLASSLSVGLSIVALKKQQKKSVFKWLLLSFLLGFTFVGLEYNEFAKIIQYGYSWQSSGFLSAFFTLVGLQGLHVIIGLLWMIILAVQVGIKGLHPTMPVKFACMGLFWDFLNIIWIFIFSMVYLMGAL